MGHVRETLHIDAAVDVCWDIYSDPNRILEWQEGIVELKDSSGKLDRVGASYSPVFRLAGRKLETRLEVTKVEKPRRIEVAGPIAGGGKGQSTVTFEPSAGGTEMTFELDYELPGGFVGDLADKLFMERAIERQIRHSSENFKALCEAKVPAHA